MSPLEFKLARLSAKAAMGIAVIASLASVPAAAQSDSGRVYEMSELTVNPTVESPERAARIIQNSYPDQLLQRSIGGSVRLQFIIGPDGAVDQSSITVIAATIRRLGEAAKDAVGRVKFTPAEVDGRPVRTQIEFPVVYRVR